MQLITVLLILSVVLDQLLANEVQHPHTERKRMAQDYQSIGSASSELDAVAAQHQGWPDDTVRPEIEEYTENSDFSFYDRRANAQALGRSIDNMAAHVETSAAAQPVRPFDPFHPGGAS